MKKQQVTPDREGIFKKLLDLASSQDKAELMLCANSFAAAKSECNVNPGRKTMEDMSAASVVFDNTLERMAERYLEKENDQDAERFSNRKQAWEWLVSAGYKISRGKFYQDCLEGTPALYKNGSLSKFVVMQYGQKLDLETKGGDLLPASAMAADHEARKLKAEADIACMKAERMRRDEDKYWLHADDAWASIAALIGTLRDAITHYLHEGARDVVTIAGGDQARSQEVFEGMEQLVNQAFNEVAGAEINVEFEREVG